MTPLEMGQKFLKQVMSTKFPSKIILFGEYAVIKGADALIMPFDTYSGYLEVTNLEVDKSLWSFYESLNESMILKSQLDLRSLLSDIKNGLRFISNIPQGMGLGSSGALCAAIFDKYAFDKTTEFELLKEYFSLMESHFHGKSSGIDPLVSFVKRTLYIDNNKKTEVVQRPSLSNLGTFHLLNSNIQRHTAPLVHSFLKDFSDPSLDDELKKFIKLSNSCIQNIFKSDCEKFSENFRSISEFQVKYFKNMIPKSLYSIWEHGLKTDAYYLKLCGAGGGGFFICYSKDTVVNLENLSLIS